MNFGDIKICYGSIRDSINYICIIEVDKENPEIICGADDIFDGYTDWYQILYSRFLRGLCIPRSDWFENSDWNNLKDRHNVITKEEKEAMPKQFRGRARFLNKQIRAWKRIYNNEETYSNNSNRSDAVSKATQLEQGIL